MKSKLEIISRNLNLELKHGLKMELHLEIESRN